MNVSLPLGPSERSGVLIISPSRGVSHSLLSEAITVREGGLWDTGLGQRSLVDRISRKEKHTEMKLDVFH